MKGCNLVLVRHGESVWNKVNNFTGWTDVELSKKGKKEAVLAGKLLKKNNFNFEYCYTSLLKRAIHTTWKILKELDQSWLSIHNTWRLNERHYGRLQGLNKSEIAKEYGEEKVYKWRRSFEGVPPKMKNQHDFISCNDKRYQHLKKNQIPASESLELTLKRVVPYWEKFIFPRVKDRKNVLVVAHGNSLRALMKYLSNIGNKEIEDLYIPTGIPIMYYFGKNTFPLKYSLLKN